MAMLVVSASKYNELSKKYETLQKDYEKLRADYNRVSRENAVLREEINGLRQENAKLRQENTELRKQVEELTATTRQILIQIKELTDKNAVLTERVNMNSQNSSKPPSSDTYQKPTPKSLRQSTGRKAGGQEGHEGHSITYSLAPDEIIKHIPTQCEACPNRELCAQNARLTATGYVIDAVNQIKIEEHQAFQCICVLTNETLSAGMPDGITSSVQYGAGVRAMVTTLYTRGVVSIGRIAEYMDGLGIPISEGTIANIIEDCVDRVYSTRDRIYEAIIESDIAHFDETGVRAAEKLHWGHVASTDKYTYIYVEEKRGKVGMNAGGILPLFRHTGVHDCFSPYFTYKFMRHALCNDHVQRELQSVTDNQKQPWAEAMSKLFYNMEDIKQTDLAKGVNCPSPETLESVNRKYDAILARARLENALPEPDTPAKSDKGGQPVKNKKTAALINRLATRKGEYCLFFEDYTVPRSNNQAERDFRMFKVKLKVSGCFRTLLGADDYAILMSYIGTAKKHGVNAFTAILRAFQGQAREVIFPN